MVLVEISIPAQWSASRKVTKEEERALSQYPKYAIAQVGIDFRALELWCDGRP